MQEDVTILPKVIANSYDPAATIPQSFSPLREEKSSCLRATPVAALTVHRTVIHYRDDASLTLYTREPLGGNP